MPTLRKFLHRDDELPFANCYFAGSDASGEIIVLEDLCQFGFEMAVRKEYLDLEHCVAVVKVNIKLSLLHIIMIIVRKSFSHNVFSVQCFFFTKKQQETKYRVYYLLLCLKLHVINNRIVSSCKKFFLHFMHKILQICKSSYFDSFYV